jgi:hypothetical protein
MKTVISLFGILFFANTALAAASETTQYRCELKEKKLSFQVRQFRPDEKSFGYKLVVVDTTDAKDPYAEIFTTERLNSQYDSGTKKLVWNSIGLRLVLDLNSPNSERFDAVNGEVYSDGNAAIPDNNTRDNYITVNEAAVCFLEAQRM